MPAVGDRDDEWHEIEHFVSKITALTQSCSSLEEFSTEAISRAVGLLDAEGGSVWITSEEQGLIELCKVDRNGEQLTPSSPGKGPHEAFLQS
ncbi:MAG: hypothetical protein KDB00_00845, partial [Planctomycetales bacterium]|nr:hypothetical protein [Planctomycetales bacterium]